MYREGEKNEKQYQTLSRAGIHGGTIFFRVPSEPFSLQHLARCSGTTTPKSHVMENTGIEVPINTVLRKAKLQ